MASAVTSLSLYGRLQSRRTAKLTWQLKTRMITIGVVASVLIISLLASSLVARPRESQVLDQRNGILIKRDEACRLVHGAIDKCAFVRTNCPDEEAGLLSYLGLYYCSLSGAEPVALIILLLWLGVLFSTIGIAASDFFSINLSTISTLLGLSESVAGVTFLAFGNGSPDVFSTFAAFNTHSGSLAIGELIGAAGFITAVVAGSMALVRPFKVAKKSFVRDVCCFIVAASFSLVFLADGRLSFWECAVMVGFYVSYVIFVVVWQWVVGSTHRKKLKEAKARSHFSISDQPGQTVESDVDDEGGIVGGSISNTRGVLPDDFAALERAGHKAPVDADEQAQLEAREHWMVEINRNMRVQRPGLGQHRNTGKSIRPSLVGALEFRAVLSSLEKSRSQRAIPIGIRRYSDDPTFTSKQQQYHDGRGRSSPQVDQLLKRTDAREADSPWRPYRDVEDDRPGRSRAVSANDAYALRTDEGDIHDPNMNMKLSSQGQRAIGSNTRRTHAQNLRVPGLQDTLSPQLYQIRDVGQPPQQPLAAPVSDLLNQGAYHPAIIQDDTFLHMNDQQTEHDGHFTNLPIHHSPRTTASSPLAPFPPYHDDPNYMLPPSRPHSIRLPQPSVDPGTFFDSSDTFTNSRLLRWWPYAVLPSPSVLISTLFPTLFAWNEKSLSERILGILSAPAIFLLTITLPVVELEKGPDELDGISPNSGEQHDADPTTAVVPGVSPPAHPQESLGEASQTYLPNPSSGARVIISTPDCTTPDVTIATRDETFISEQSRSVGSGWNRWLLSTQIFTAPFFVVLIFWANMDEKHSIRNLAMYTLYAILGSLIVLGFLLTATTEKRPPKYQPAFCFVGFIVSVAWISTIAGEVVGVLKALGVILGISDAILGLTIFAVGNSLGDLVADITVAKLGFPVMALSACFGGPMLNILLGIGISGLYMTIKERHGKHHQHEGPVVSKPYHIEVHGTLIISGISLLVTLLGLLIAVPLNRWIIDRKIGWSLVLLWTISTIANVIIEATGVTGQLAY